MTNPKKCSKCGSTQVINEVKVVDTYDEDLKVQVQQRPQALLLKGTVRVPLKAQVCSTCGYTELYATDPKRVLEAHEQVG